MIIESTTLKELKYEEKEKRKKISLDAKLTKQDHIDLGIMLKSIREKLLKYTTYSEKKINISLEKKILKKIDDIRCDLDNLSTFDYPDLEKDVYFFK